MNITKVTESIYRGPAPETDWDFLQIVGASGPTKFKTVLNLETGWFEFLHHKTDYETEVMITAGIAPVRLHLSDFFPPSKPALVAAASLMAYRTPENRIYVHCLHGKDRTGMAIAAYRVIYQGWAVDQAIEEMYSEGFHRFPYEALGWVRAFRKYFGGTS